MIHVIRGSLFLLAALALAACGGGGDGEPAEKAGAGPGAGAAAPAGEPAKAKGDLTMADVQQAGYTQDREKSFEMVGAIAGGGGTMAGDRVEVYAYAGEVPADRLENLKQMANPAFGWQGVCHVRNVVMFYENQAACDALRKLD